MPFRLAPPTLSPTLMRSVCRSTHRPARPPKHSVQQADQRRTTASEQHRKHAEAECYSLWITTPKARPEMRGAVAKLSAPRFQGRAKARLTKPQVRTWGAVRGAVGRGTPTQLGRAPPL